MGGLVAHCASHETVDLVAGGVVGDHGEAVVAIEGGQRGVHAELFEQSLFVGPHSKTGEVAVLGCGAQRGAQHLRPREIGGQHLVDHRRGGCFEEVLSFILGSSVLVDEQELLRVRLAEHDSLFVQRNRSGHGEHRSDAGRIDDQYAVNGAAGGGLVHLCHRRPNRGGVR